MADQPLVGWRRYPSEGEIGPDEIDEPHLRLAVDEAGHRYIAGIVRWPMTAAFQNEIYRSSIQDHLEHLLRLWDDIADTAEGPPESEAESAPSEDPSKATEDHDSTRDPPTPTEAPPMTNPQPTPTTTHADAGAEAASEDPLEPTVDDDPGDDGPTRYYLLKWNAPDDRPVPTTTADSAVEAAWELAPRDLKAAPRHPPGEAWMPHPDPTPDLRLVIDAENHRYVVDEATWPETTTRTHGAVRDRYNEQEVEAFEENWEQAAEKWRKLASDDYPGEYDGPTTKRDDPEDVLEEQRSSGWIHPDYAEHLFYDRNLRKLGYERRDGDWYAVVKQRDTPEDGKAWRVGWVEGQ